MRISKKQIKANGSQNLTSRFAVVVEVVSFTFHFATVAQLRECLAYYETKTHPSSRIPAKEYLLEEPKRQKVIKALNNALRLIESGKHTGLPDAL